MDYFFGEMALFDRLPRSASCIALTDTICVAINKNNVGQFLANCPELVKKILANMSMRIRDLDNELHRVLNSMNKHHLNFFRMNPAIGNQVRELLKQQKDVVDGFVCANKTLFDRMILRYLQAIYLNEKVNASDNVLIGTLWMNLYWLSKDVQDDMFAAYCAGHAADKFAEALGREEISGVKSKCSIALSLANLLIYLGREKEAWRYCDIAERSMDDRIRQCVLQMKLSLVK